MLNFFIVTATAVVNSKRNKAKMNMKCQRCGKETCATIMSMFNTEMICISCKEDEQKRPDYQDAVKADEMAIGQGNFNFRGIGFR
jgi:PHP family Zn ribbon phosphoesterase